MTGRSAGSVVVVVESGVTAGTVVVVVADGDARVPTRASPSERLVNCCPAVRRVWRNELTEASGSAKARATLRPVPSSCVSAVRRIAWAFRSAPPSSATTITMRTWPAASGRGVGVGVGWVAVIRIGSR